MAINGDPLSSPIDPLRVSYAIGRMLGADDFQAEQNYHRGRLARMLASAVGTGTVSGLKVQVKSAAAPADVELQVTAGVAIDRAGRIIEVPSMVCLRLDAFLSNKKASAPQDLLNAFKAGQIVADVFLTFVAADRGKTPSFATMDDYDATDAFVPNRLLDSFAMLLVLRADADPKLPQDAWAGVGPLRAPGSSAADPTADTLKQHILDADLGPALTPVEYPSDPTFDRTSVFLARLSIKGAQAPAGAVPTWDLTAVTVNNLSRLFLYPAALAARWAGLTTGEV
ncbi:MAG TPA: hypothetical protein VG871_06150 [Vicinamibacterales bacterium]|nr:hypothetical protein [Vicinamibacterales bacterium]